MYPKCVQTQQFALLKSIINSKLYHTLQYTSKRRNRKFSIFLFIVSEVLRNLIAVSELSVVAGIVPVVGCLNM